MEKETPTESIPERLNRKDKERLDANTAELKELAKDVDSSETPTEEWEREFEAKFIASYFMSDGAKNAVKSFIRSLITSHDAELARKIEGIPIRSYNISATQIRQFVDRDAVLALLNNK